MENEIKQVSVYVIENAKYEYREHYKKHGARWNPERKEWYCLANDKGTVFKLMGLRVHDPPIWHTINLVSDKYEEEELAVQSHQSPKLDVGAVEPPKRIV